VALERVDAWDLWSLHAPSEHRPDAINGLLHAAQAELPQGTAPSRSASARREK